MATLDPEDQTLTLWTEDFNLLGESFYLEISAYSSHYEETEVQPMVLMITLSTTGPKFT